MYIKTAFMSGWSVLSAAAAACMVFAGTAAPVHAAKQAYPEAGVGECRDLPRLRLNR